MIWGLWILVPTWFVATAGCETMAVHRAENASAGIVSSSGMPRELCKTVLPAYTVEPPDILVIDAVHIVPRSPYHLRILDAVRIRVERALPDAPIDGIYPVELGGAVNLGPPYGPVQVAGLTVEQAQQVIFKRLTEILRDPLLSMSLADIASKQQIAGQHLVGPDGTVTLGSYGSVTVVGMTLGEARMAIERYLSQFLEDPEVSVDVFAYNSKVYYIITQGAGFGDAVYRFPITGNETVLDALSQIHGMTGVSSKKIWIARPSPCCDVVQVLPVDWEGITAQGKACTNFQVLPGDRVFVAEDKLIALDTGLGKLFAPLERVMGFSLFGVGTVTRFSGPVLKGGGNAQSSF
jgi:polysaccharide export outer membrane protein